jgi:diguanylate cyclase (GGDEF)-like protein
MKVIIADDEVVSRRLLESSLSRWGYEVVVASDGLEASKILCGTDPPKLAVLDWLMPGLDGVQLCRELRQRKDESYTYVLLLTAKHTKSDVIQGLEAGADDYLTKPFDPQELRVRLRTGKRILYLLDQLTMAQETLRDLAARDPLTKLWNHNTILDHLTSEINRAERQGTSIGVVMIDLDHFKQINDTYGHLVGDHVLRAAAEAMSETVRPYDGVGRFGGEEFLIVLPGCDEINASSHAERLRLALQRAGEKTPNQEVHFTASVGVTVVGPDARVDTKAAIHAADAAMYAAKRAGRDRVEFLPADSQLTSA